MAVTSMRSISWLLPRLTQHFPELSFTPGDQFAWNPVEDVIYYNPSGSSALLLHETGHALLAHTSYNRDITLIAMERDAWEKAVEIASLFDQIIDDDLIQDHLDTYRNWIHKRSICPICQLNGHQVKSDTYSCLNCHSRWTVNDARLCGLQRHLIASQVS